MKKTFIACTLSLFFPLFAEGFHLSLGAVMGLKNGILDEYVYSKNTSGNYKKLSELNWDIENIPYFGTEVDFSYNSVFFNLYASGAIPKRSGTMVDSDWLGITSSTPFTEKTNLSYSENTLEDAFFLSTEGGYSFSFTDFFDLKASLGLSYNIWSFSGKNGYGWYGNAETAYYNGTYYGKGELNGITLERKDFNLFAKIQPEFIIAEKYKISPFFKACIFSYLSEFDHHKGDNGAYYLDQGLEFFTLFDAGIKLSADIKKITVSAGYNLNFSRHVLTGSYSNTTDDEAPYYKSRGKGGFSQTIHDISISVKYNFF